MTHLRSGGRTVEALTMQAALHVLEDRQSSAIETLTRVLEEPSPQGGWSIPIDPLFAPLRVLPAFDSVSRTLASRPG